MRILTTNKWTLTTDGHVVGFAEHERGSYGRNEFGSDYKDIAVGDAVLIATGGNNWGGPRYSRAEAVRLSKTRITVRMVSGNQVERQFLRSSGYEYASGSRYYADHLSASRPIYSGEKGQYGRNISVGDLVEGLGEVQFVASLEPNGHKGEYQQISGARHWRLIVGSEGEAIVHGDAIMVSVERDG